MNNRPVFLSYLPADVPDEILPQPRYAFDADDKEVTITYFPREGNSALIPVTIELTESTQEAQFDGDVTMIQGKEVRIDEYPGRDGGNGASASVTAFWKQSGISVFADFTWVGENGQSTLLTEGMREFALSFTETIIDQEEP